MVENKERREKQQLLGLFHPIPQLNSSRTTHTSNSSMNQAEGTTTDAADFVPVKADINAPAGSTEYMMGLFAPPQSSLSNQKSLPSERPNVEKLSNDHNRIQSFQSELSPISSSLSPATNYASLSSPKNNNNSSHTPQSSIDTSVIMIGEADDTPKTCTRRLIPMQIPKKHSRVPSAAMPVISESLSQTTYPLNGSNNSNFQHHYRNDKNIKGQEQVVEKTSFKFNLGNIINIIHSIKNPTTYIGSFVYLLYHVVFCLALGSAIMRPNNPTSILGLMTKTGALGTLVASPLYWVKLSNDVPALYPTADLFLAPFLAKLALIVDETLANDDSITETENDAVFLASFGVLTAIGTFISSCLLLLASVFKLANLGSYLPFPVICGFFTAVGILTWHLAINVDTGGTSIATVLKSGDIDLMRHFLVHHIPTLIVAGFMKYLGPKNPLFVCFVVVVTVALFYLFMVVTGTSLDEMKENGWFWSHEELVYEGYSSTLGFDDFAPPAPFGVFGSIRHVHWGAVRNGASTSIALGFLYLIRCSVHGAALKKNIPNLTRRETIVKENETLFSAEEVKDEKNAKSHSIKSRKFSEAVDIEAVMMVPLVQDKTHNKKITNINNKEADIPKYCTVYAKPTSISLKNIYLAYGWSQIITVIVGGFPITPSVAASPTMFSLGADGLGPQIGSVLLLFLFYLTDFQIVGYIPKPAFSSMLVLSFFDMIVTWFYKSFFKTKDKWEWIVVPAIVVCAFELDLLSAVFLGIAFSTFIFVGAFFRSGVVKYVANGQCINSTIVRPSRMSQFLKEKGDLIQVLTLQNYLFFGNASSIYCYVFELFESNNDGEVCSTKSKPKFLILDLTLVSGIDTSAVDVLSQIKNLCTSNKCKLFMAGMSQNIRSILSFGGFKPDAGTRSKRQLRFFARLDAALGKAEDMLLDLEFVDAYQALAQSGMRRLMISKQSGFQIALLHIDTEHGSDFSRELEGLEKYTTMIELRAGETLYEDGYSRNIERGLFFIEIGVLKLSFSGNTATKGTEVGNGQSLKAGDTLTKMKKCSLIGSISTESHMQTFRLARLGVGWVAGTMEFFHMKDSGNHVALDFCKLHHIPFSKIADVEKENPFLVLTLYKLLSNLMAQRQEATIGQLATLHSIMSSPGR